MVFFFYGKNSYASRRKLQAMVERYIKTTGSDFGLERFDGLNVTYDQLMASLQAMPFLATSRLVIVEYLSNNKTVADQLLKRLDDVPASTVVVFYESDVDQRTTYFKTMARLKNAVRFDPLSVPQLLSWVLSQAKAQGGSIDRLAINVLLDRVGDDQWRLEQEINKLVNHETIVTVDSVKKLVEQTQEQSIFELVDAMTSGQLASSMRSYQGLLAVQTNEIYILSMIIWQMRNLLLAKAGSDMSSKDLAKQAGLSPYVATKMLTKQRGYSLDQLKNSFIQAVETDYAIKSGQGRADVLVEQLIYRIAMPVSRPV